MRFFKLGCGVFLVLVVAGMAVAYSRLIAKPDELYVEVIKQALAQSAERHKEWPAKLQDPKVNGFLQPKLRAYWSALEPSTSREYKSIENAVDGWVDRFTTQGSGHAVDHEALLKVKSVEYLSARSAFVELLPELVSAFEKPMFQPPGDDFLRPTMGIQFEHLKKLAMGLNGYAESLVAEGDAARATFAYQLVFRMGKLISEDTSVVQTFAGVTIQGLAFQSFVGHISDQSSLSFEVWRSLSLALAKSAITNDQLHTALQNDAARGIAFLESPRASFDGDARYLRGLYLLPRMQERDQRIYKNLMGAALEAAEKKPSLPSAPIPSPTSFFAGDTSWAVSSLLLPADGYRIEGARLQLHSAKLGGLAAFVGICTYRASFNKWPQNLAQLDQVHILAPGGYRWASIGGIKYYSDGKRPDIEVLLPPDVYEQAQVSLNESSILEGTNSTYFRLGPKQYWFSTSAPSVKKARKES